MQEPTIDDLRRIGGLKWSADPELLGAWVAEMDFGVAPPIADALHRMVDDGLFGYLPPRLSAELAESVAQWHATSYGWQIDPSHVRWLPDVIKGFEEAMDTFSEPGSKIVLPTPAYMPFLTVPRLHDREIIELPMLRDDDGWHMDLDGLDAAFAQGGGLLVMCNPHNPIGKVYTTAEMRQISDVVHRRGARVFSDEIHAPLVYDGATHVPYATVDSRAAAHTVTATSASKAWNLPGLKCAQLILSNDDDVRRFDDEAFWASHGTSIAGVVANIAAYRDGRPWLAQTLAYLRSNRDLIGSVLADQLPEIGYLAPEGTYLALLDVRRLGLENPAAYVAEHAGLKVTDGADCGVAARGHLRLNFATPRPILEQALTQLASALRRRSA